MTTEQNTKSSLSQDSVNHRYIFQWNSIGSLSFGLLFALLTFWNTCHVWAMIYDMHMNDFGKFYYATVAFLNDQAMYGPNPATYIQVTDDYGQHFWNLNPPHFHILLLPFAILPEFIAFLLWTAVNFAALFVSFHWIQNELNLSPSPNQRRLLTIGFLAFAGTGAHFVTGQLSFLLVLPITLAWLHARHGQWNKVGIYLGIAASIKLFLLIFIPYLLLRRQFQAIGVFVGILFTAYVSGVAIFGIDIHMQWIARISEVDWFWASMNASLLGTLSRIFAESPTFDSALSAHEVIYPLWYFFSAILASLTFCVSASDTSPRSADRAFTILLLSAILISPLGWIYYLFLLLGPLTSVIYHWHTSAPLEKSYHLLKKRRIQTLLLIGSIPGLLVPLVALILFDQSPLYTVTIGSSYFWSTLMMWIYCIIDWKRDHVKWSWGHLVSFNQSWHIFQPSNKQI